MTAPIVDTRRHTKKKETMEKWNCLSFHVLIIVKKLKTNKSKIPTGGNIKHNIVLISKILFFNNLIKVRI